MFSFVTLRAITNCVVLTFFLSILGAIQSLHFRSLLLECLVLTSSPPTATIPFRRPLSFSSHLRNPKNISLCSNLSLAGRSSDMGHVATRNGLIEIPQIALLCSSRTAYLLYNILTERVPNRSSVLYYSCTVRSID